MRRFEGIFTVMLTFYDEDGNIDLGAMSEMTGFLIDSGVHGLVVLGSNGECPYLRRDLQKAAIDCVVESCGGTVPVIVGINERGTEPALEMARYAAGAGADGLLVALPLFYTLDDDSVYFHYEAICREVGLPVIFYNWPDNTRLDVTPGFVGRLSGIDGLVGIKETVFDVETVRAHVDATHDDFSVFTGMCFNLSATMEVGACGAICPLPNVVPDKAVALYNAMVEGDPEKAGSIQAELYAFAPLLATSPHATMKEALSLLGHNVNTAVKPPLPQLSDEQAAVAREVLQSTGLVKRL